MTSHSLLGGRSPWLRRLVGAGTATLLALPAVGFVGVAAAARPSRPLLSISNVSLVEGNAGTTDAIFTVTASAAPTRKGTSVSFVTADGTATGGVDYLATASPKAVS